jgi:hypothetical protein
MTATQVKLRSWPGMRLSWTGAGAVVHSGEEPTEGAATLAVTPHGSSECAVVVSSHNVSLEPEMIEELAEVLAHGLPRGFASLRFVAWDGACANGDNPAAAHILAVRLGIDVVSAGGPLLGVPGGSLFTPVGRGPQRPGGWWRFRAGHAPVRVGWRFPEPAWEAELPEARELPGDLVLDHVPAGLWLHRRSAGAAVTDLAYSVPTDNANPALILSHPSDAPLRRDEMIAGIGAIPQQLIERMVFTPYGECPIADGQIGPMVAELIGRAVHVRTGLPLCAPAGQRAVVTIDNKGLPRWRTFARELWHAPRAGSPRTVDWINPAPEVLTVSTGAATFALGAGWVCEVIQAGLWVRPEQLAEPADWVRGLPVDVNRCAIVLGAPHAAEITPPGHMIADVLERMPVDARKRAFIAVPRGAAPNVFVLATALRDRLPEGSEVELLGAEPAPASAHASTYPAAGATASHAAARGPAGLHSAAEMRGSHGMPATHDDDVRHNTAVVSDAAARAGATTGFHRDVSSDRFDVPSRPYRSARRDSHGEQRFDRPADSRHGAPSRMPTPRQPLQQFTERSAASFESTTIFQRPVLDREPAHDFQPSRDFQPRDRRMPRDLQSPAEEFKPSTPAHGFPAVQGFAPGQDFAPGREFGPEGGAEEFKPSTPAHGFPAVPPVAQPHDFHSPSTPPRGFPQVSPSTPAHGVPQVRPAGYAPSPSTPPRGMPQVPPSTPPRGMPQVPTGSHGLVAGQPAPSGPSHDYQQQGFQPEFPHQQGFPQQDFPQQEFAPQDFTQQDFAQQGVQSHGFQPQGQQEHGFQPQGQQEHGFQPQGLQEQGFPERGFQPQGLQQQGAQQHGLQQQEFPPQDFAPPTEFIALPVPAAQQEPERDETPTGSLRVDKEIRSHRTGSKPAKRADDRTSTQELDRLLGFFDEIRRAKAWDEDPKQQDESEARRAGRGAKRARR